MLLNFKDSHTPNVDGPFLCKCLLDCWARNNFEYRVLTWDKKKQIFIDPDTPSCEFFGRVVGWVRIREE